jgi:hypothetical protein
MWAKWVGNRPFLGGLASPVIPLWQHSHPMPRSMPAKAAIQCKGFQGGRPLDFCNSALGPASRGDEWGEGEAYTSKKTVSLSPCMWISKR